MFPPLDLGDGRPSDDALSFGIELHRAGDPLKRHRIQSLLDLLGYRLDRFQHLSDRYCPIIVINRHQTRNVVISLLKSFPKSLNSCLRLDIRILSADKNRSFDCRPSQFNVLRENHRRIPDNLSFHADLLFLPGNQCMLSMVAPGH